MIILLLIATGGLVLIGGVGVAWRMTHPDRRSLGYALAKGLATEPSELGGGGGMGYLGSERVFKMEDGVELPAWIVEGELVEGPVLVLTHGWSSCRYWSLQKVVRYAKYVSKIVVYDLRGHGDSTGKICTLGVKEPGDLLGMVNELAAEGMGSEGFVLYGSSMGAGIAVSGASEGIDRGMGEMIKGVVLDGPYRWAMEPVSKHLWRMGWPAEPMSVLAHGIVRVCLGGGGRIYDRAHHAGRLSCPLLVMHGGKDPICSTKGAKEIAGAAAKGVYVEFKEGGHGDLASADEDLYTDAIERFFKAVSDTIVEGDTVRETGRVEPSNVRVGV